MEPETDCGRRRDGNPVNGCRCRRCTDRRTHKSSLKRAERAAREPEITTIDAALLEVHRLVS